MTTTTERDDIVELLQNHRAFLRQTVAGLSEEQARARPTASELCLGGLIKHVSATEASWARFAREGSDPDEPDWSAVDWSNPPPAVLARRQEFVLLEEETLSGVLEAYEKVAAATDDLVRTLDLDQRHPLPAAPWFEPGATRSVRRVFLHVAAETAQHAGHADILRETIDGQKTMG